jgi:hypothetical protein
VGRRCRLQVRFALPLPVRLVHRHPAQLVQLHQVQLVQLFPGGSSCPDRLQPCCRPVPVRVLRQLPLTAVTWRRRWLQAWT